MRVAIEQVPTEDRYWSKVDRRGPEECWPWSAGTGTHGYGVAYYRGVQVTAHRLALILTVGEPPVDRTHALHSRTCTTKLCCNPGHLRWGTHQDNMEDAGATGAMKRQRKSMCPHGHAMTPENILVRIKRWKGREYEAHACRECNRLYLERRRARNGGDVGAGKGRPGKPWTEARRAAHERRNP